MKTDLTILIIAMWTAVKTMQIQIWAPQLAWENNNNNNKKHEINVTWGSAFFSHPGT